MSACQSRSETDFLRPAATRAEPVLAVRGAFLLERFRCFKLGCFLDFAMAPIMYIPKDDYNEFYMEYRFRPTRANFLFSGFNPQLLNRLKIMLDCTIVLVHYIS